MRTWRKCIVAGSGLLTLSLCVLSIIVSERTLHGALSWQPKDRDRLFLNYR